MKVSDEDGLFARALAMYAGDQVLAHVRANGEKALIPTREWRLGTTIFVDASPIAPPAIGVIDSRMPEWHERYLFLLSEEILSGGGTLDTILGDSVSGWWAGDDAKANATAACGAAASMARKLVRLNELAEHRGYLKVLLRIGIASGHLAVGAYGSSKRLRFGALGDTVNMAYRLCSIAQPIDQSQVLICDETRALLPSSIRSSRTNVRRQGAPQLWPVNVVDLAGDS